jgi:hypothetical protein
MAKSYVKSSAQMMRAYNLPTVDDKGRRMSIHLSRGEVSRPLTEAEMGSAEIQKGLAARDLLDVTKQMNS